MKKFLSFLFFLTFFLETGIVFAFDIPEKPKNFVNDYANIFSVEERTSLENKISAFEKQTTNEIAVVTLPSLKGDSVENVAQDIFTKWGIGKKEKNNGVLLLITMEEHKTRIHTGYGVEGDLTDLASSYIQSDIMTPAFREGNYFVGVNGALDKMIEALNGENVVPENYSNEEGSGLNWKFIFFAGIFVLQWVFAIFARSKSWWAGGVFGGIVGVIIWLVGSLSTIFSIIILIFLVLLGLGLDFVVSKAYQNAKGTNRHFPWWIGGGGFGGHGGSGGFGGFGGGFSGGGGSSGSW